MALRLKRARYHSPETRRRRGAPRGSASILSAPGAEDAATEAAVEKHREQTQRLQAEFENFRRRTRRDMEEIRKTAGSATIKNLLPVVDNFARALQTPAASLESFTEGIRMIHGLFMNLLRESGLERIEALGQTFDPNFHEAVSVDSSGEQPENQVVEILQDGYLLQGKLIRPAMVRVARHE